MEWNSIKMSKAEFERLQKEYTEAAMKAAEKRSIRNRPRRYRLKLRGLYHRFIPSQKRYSPLQMKVQTCPNLPKTR